MTTAEIAAPPVARDVEDVLRAARSHALPPEGGPRDGRRVDVRRDGDPARRLRGADLREPVGPERADAGAREQRRTGRFARREPDARAARRPDRPPGDLPVLDPLVRGLHRDDRPVVGAVVGDDVPLPRGARARRDARRRSLDALRVPAAAASRATARLPRLLVAGGPAARDRALVRFPRADVRPLRRLELALPVRRRGVPGRASRSSCAGRCPRARTSWRATDESARRRRC